LQRQIPHLATQAAYISALKDGVLRRADKILYLHGLGSSGQSNTAQQLLTHGLDIIAPTYRAEHYQESITSLSSMLKNNKIDVIVGTSMGGYYALKLAEITQLPVVAINPCFEPLRFFEHYCQYPVMNYVTNEPIEISSEQANAFELIDTLRIHNPQIIVGRNDTVIPAHYQQTFCLQQGWTFIETDWGHRIEDPMLLVQLLTHLSKCGK
jgi:predicted esterase YcpF (UPF0227 family)